MARLRRSSPKEKIVEALSAASNMPGSESSMLSANASRVAEGAQINGELEFSGNMYFSGKLEGSILAREGNLELSKSGKVDGDIHCQILDCYGQITGNIQAQGKSILRNNCKLVGDILTKQLSIQSGAQINGHCKMLGNKINMDFFSMPIENLRKNLKLEK